MSDARPDSGVKQRSNKPLSPAAKSMIAGVLALTPLGCAAPKAILHEGVVRESVEGTDGRVISYLRGGDAGDQRIVYVHGTPGDATNFQHFLTGPLAIEGTEAISIDRPGFGDSAPGGAVVTFASQASAIEPLLVERHGRWPILVGHSLGGPIVAWAASEWPERVGGLVIVAGSLDPELEKPRWYNHAAGFPLVSAVIGGAMRTSNAEIMAAPRETERLDERVDRITAPTIVVHGRKDGLVPVKNVDYIERAFTNTAVRTTVLDHAGHLIPWRQPEAIREAVQSLIDPAGEPD